MVKALVVRAIRERYLLFLQGSLLPTAQPCLPYDEGILSPHRWFSIVKSKGKT